MKEINQIYLELRKKCQFLIKIIQVMFQERNGFNIYVLKIREDLNLEEI
jgi:hypothetical protein